MSTTSSLAQAPSQRPENTLIVPDATRLAQQRAATPQLSVWVSANAGSGKTRVLTDRVLRLLLQGVKPGQILCLTYTTAAAANMSIRIFDALAHWVTLDDATLYQTITDLQGIPPTPSLMRKARRLFAHAVETPGGLKIETIHAFCQRVLKQFPFEANVPAHFSILDDAQNALLFDAALSHVLSLSNTDLLIRNALDCLTPLYGEDAIKTLLNEALGTLRSTHATGVTTWPQRLKRLQKQWGLEGDYPSRDVMKTIRDEGIPLSQWPRIIQALQEGSTNDKSKANDFLAAFHATGDAQTIKYTLAFFTKDKSNPKHPVKSVMTKATAKIHPEIAALLEAEKSRLGELYPRLQHALILERTRALITLTQALDVAITARKRVMGWLSFDDLLQATVDLFQRAEAAWVLYKLDAGLEHLLVDEAQDTNPAQWQILNALVEEFSAGVGVRDRDAMPRTVFAVGDPKQSIYSFQGAAPHEFEETGRFFQKKLGATGDFANVSLTLSFRSAPAILSAVDAVFSVDAHAEGLSASHPPEKPIHQSARPYASGCVEIWPLLRLDATLAPDPWSLPVDEPESGSPTVRNARRIAEQIKTWLNEGGLWGQHVNAGDILILARKRGAAFEAVIKALKDAGVPVTGSDKLILNNHIAVHDLIAAGKNALHPHDDLNLGAVLVSPLIGWDQDALYDMAVSRGDDTSLWHALEKQALNAEPARVAFEKLKQWQQLAQHSGPFGFYSTLLSAQGGRLALLSRLGVEADDVISAFLSRALDHEHQKTPCLITFLRDLESTQTSVKRDMDTNAQEVRVMTVHGAKGLEAPVVILLDDCKDHKPPPKVINKILNLVDQGTAIPVLVQGKGEDTPALTPHREQADRLIRDEHHRLLYVAMTRARDHLIVAPTIGTKPKEPNDGGWSMMIRKGLSAQQAAQFEMNLVIDTCDESDYPALKWGRWDYKTSPVPIHITAQKPHSPSWLHQPVMNDVRVEPSIMRPSSTVQHGDESTRIRGMIIHTLLQKLPYIPAQQRADKGRRWLAAHATQITDEQQQSWLDDVLSVIDTPELAPLFHENSQAEVAIKGTIQKNGMPVLVSGRIDRIAIFGDRIIIADFKTSLNPPNDQSAIPVSHKQQMRAYRDVLALLYPQKAIETWLVYTAQTTCFKID